MHTHAVIHRRGLVPALVFALLALGAGPARATENKELPIKGRAAENKVFQVAGWAYPGQRNAEQRVGFTLGVHIEEGYLHFAIDAPWTPGSVVARATLQSIVNVPPPGEVPSPVATILGRTVGLVVDDDLGHVSGICPVFPLATRLTGPSPNLPGVSFSAIATAQIEFKIQGLQYVVKVEVEYSPTAQPMVDVFDPRQ